MTETLAASGQLSGNTTGDAVLVSGIDGMLEDVQHLELRMTSNARHYEVRICGETQLDGEQVFALYLYDEQGRALPREIEGFIGRDEAIAGALILVSEDARRDQAGETGRATS